MSVKSDPSPSRRRARRGASWDVAAPVVGLVFLFLEVSPRPVFDGSPETYRVLMQFPLLALVLICAWEKRFLPALLSMSVLGALQSWPGLATLPRTPSMDALFPVFAWAFLLLSYLHPSRRAIYLVTSNEKEPKP